MGPDRHGSQDPPQDDLSDSVRRRPGADTRVGPPHVGALSPQVRPDSGRHAGRGIVPG
ncbi:hypothetical protein MILUP08_42410 [Micromonospora lupini str. Lupac 08]|uniref:Uncharacterized protein n=1 Tax=Micromonospora lupini str. Lupac 08 TaxID=1150864 RepID=I0L0Z2_9ACTN|nr:hypothetical protein MILUP08_42410 [Micromonospora lupini str. Lupac 08]